MKKILTGALLLMFLLTGMTVFAQKSDDDFVSADGALPVEAYLGFQFNIDFQDDKVIPIPSVNLGARSYFMDIGDTGLQLGAAVFVNAGFISEMEYISPFDKDAKMTFTMADADRLMNAGVLIGASLRGDIGDAGLGFVVDVGIAGNMDTASQLSTYKYYFGTYYAGTPLYREVFELTSFNMGLGLNAAAQYRLRLQENLGLAFELGVNLSFCFYSTSDIDWYYENKDGDRKVIWKSSDYSDAGPRTRIGPYLLVGVTF